jgi:D-arabinose 5-phosphate isomerase GutQ
MPKEQLIAEAQQVVEREAAAVTSLTAQFGDSLPAVLDLLLNCKGHVLVTGIGTSGAVAERFAHLLSCCGTPALFIHAADSLHGTSGAITTNDVVYIISKGGQSAEINQFADIARARGARLIAHTEDPNAPLASRCDVVFQIKAPAGIDPFELIATGSSLVNAAACDALCVLLLRLRGYTKDDFGMTHPGGAVGKKLAEAQG